MNRRAFLGVLAGTALTVGAGAGGTLAFLRQEQFGALPEGEILKRIMASPHYANGTFHNLVPHPILSDDSSFAGALIRSLVEKRTGTVPPRPIPSLRPDLSTLNGIGDVIIWLGHSSFLIRLGGKTILIDPVFSDHASPVSFSTRAFAGTTPCSALDMPDIDILLISHDHWDHLDYPTVTALGSRIKQIVCGLGTGAHFRRWGFDGNIIREADWGECVVRDGAVRISLVTSAHYSGRSLTRNKSLWAGFVLESPKRRIFFSGDSGYGPHFTAIGKTFGAPDVALLDCGQYNERWKYIHMTPEEAVRAAKDLGARAIMPAHVGKFALSTHPWDAPFRRILEACQKHSMTLLTPRIGELFDMENTLPVFPRWWEELPPTSSVDAG